MPHRGKDIGNIDMIGRMIQAAGVRCADYDPDQLPRLLGLRYRIDEAMVTAIAGMRLQGVTWQVIGDALNVTRQAVIQAYGPAVAEVHRKKLRAVAKR